MYILVRIIIKKKNPHQNCDWSTCFFQNKISSIMSYLYASAKWCLCTTKSLYCSSFEFVLNLVRGLRTCFFICCVRCDLGPLVSLQGVKNTCRRVWFSIKLKADGAYHIQPDFELFFINSYSCLLRRIYDPTRHVMKLFCENSFQLEAVN